MGNLKRILDGRVVDVYDGAPELAAALAAHGASEVTLHSKEKNIAESDSIVTVKPYSAVLETADCVADVCVLARNAVKALVAMYPTAPTHVLLQISLNSSWLLGSIGLMRRLILGHIRIRKLFRLTDLKGQKTYWLLVQQSGQAAKKSPVLPAAIGVPTFLSWLREEKIEYVVLRFYDKLPAVYRKAGDIDLLLTNKDKARVEEYLRANEKLLQGVSQDIRLGLHAASGEQGSIPYYPPLLAKQILNNAIDGPAGSRIPAPKDALRSLIYHALYHAKKGYAAGIPSSLNKHTERNPENDYLGVIHQLGNEIGIAPGNTMEELDNYLVSEGWRPKLDTLAKLGETNAWVYDRFFASGQGGTSGLAVFMLREWVYEKGHTEKAEQLIEENGFLILRKSVLTGNEKKRASEILRGGSWGENADGTSTGWLPAVAFVVVDPKCAKMPPAYAKGYERHKIRKLKNTLRKAFDTETRGSVHSTDNAHESWEYVEICFPNEEGAIRSELEMYAQTSRVSKITNLFSLTYLKHSVRYSLREYMIRTFLS